MATDGEEIEEKNRGAINNCGVMIYQSMSGDAGTGTGTFGCTNSQMSIASNSDYYNSASFLFNTDTEVVINLNGCALNYGVFISSKGTNVSEILSKPKEPENIDGLFINGKDRPENGIQEIDKRVW